MKKCHRVGCGALATETYKDIKSTIYGDPVCSQHQYQNVETTIRGIKLDTPLSTEEFIAAAISGDLPWNPCKMCGYKEQDTRKYDGMCYQCYADKHHIYG